MKTNLTNRVRGFALLSGAIAQIVLGALPPILGWANTMASRSGDNPTLLTPPGFAFAIWGVLFAGALVYSIVHMVQGDRASAGMKRMAWWAAIAFWGNAIWEIHVPLNGFDLASLIGIAVIFAALLLALREAEADPAASLAGRLVRAPVYGMAGWLTAATFLNLKILAQIEGWPLIGAETVPAAALTLVGSATLAILTARMTASLSYIAAAGWGFWGIYLVNTERGEPVLAGLAALGIALGLLAVASGWWSRRRSTDVPDAAIA